MKASPFSDLKLSAPLDSSPTGSDQRLFRPTQPESSVGGEPQASAPPRARASVSPDEGSGARSRTAAPTPAPEQPIAPASRDGLERTHARALDRAVGRHSHDLFQDQIRWLNHLKLELSERCGEPITGNAMVQLAVDMLREDYVRNGEESQLIRVLINGQPRLSRLPEARQDVEEEGRE